MHRHRRKVLLILRQKDELYRSKFVFNHGDRICLVAYQAKRNNNPVILLSSSHSDPSLNSGESKNRMCSWTILQVKVASIYLTKIWKKFDQNLTKIWKKPSQYILTKIWKKLSVGLSYSFSIYWTLLQTTHTY